MCKQLQNIPKETEKDVNGGIRPYCKDNQVHPRLIYEVSEIPAKRQQESVWNLTNGF